MGLGPRKHLALQRSTSLSDGHPTWPETLAPRRKGSLCANTKIAESG